MSRIELNLNQYDYQQDLSSWAKTDALANKTAIEFVKTSAVLVPTCIVSSFVTTFLFTGHLPTEMSGPLISTLSDGSVSIVLDYFAPFALPSTIALATSLGIGYLQAKKNK